MSIKYTKDELVNEIWRFYCEQGKIPRQSDMSNSNGYISFSPFLREFGSWNEAISGSGLKINKHYTRTTGLEVCSICHNFKKEGRFWHHVNEQIVCDKCFSQLNRGYKKGTLDPNSTTGRGLSAENIIATYLGIKNCNVEHDFNFKYDLYHKDYGRINVRSSVLMNNVWHLHIKRNKNTILHFDTYFFVAFSEDRKNIEHIWVINVNDAVIKDKNTIGVTNAFFDSPIRNGLKRLEKYEIDVKPFNIIWNEMKKNKNNCSFFSKYYIKE